MSATILIPEDSDDDFFLLERALRKTGLPAHYVRVRDGLDAREYLEGAGLYQDRVRFPLPCLILADLKMPRMDGLDLLRWVREHPLFRRIPFLFLTSSNSLADIHRAYELGVSSYLIKPGRYDDLVALVQTVVAYWFELCRKPEFSAA